MEMATQNLAQILHRNMNVQESNGSIHQYDITNGKVSCVVALFLLSQVFLIISHPPLVQVLAWIILKCNKSMLERGVNKLLTFYDLERSKRENDGESACSTDEVNSSSSKENITETPKNITDEEKEKLATTPIDYYRITDKPFLETILNALDCLENDYIALFGLSLLYALASNKGNNLKLTPGK